MKLTNSARELLEAHGYDILVSTRVDSTLYFEDDSLIGQLVEYPSVQELLTNWARDQSEFLSRYSVSIRAAGEKSWNLYNVLLSADNATTGQLDLLKAVEDDLGAARKIIGIGLDSDESLTRCLLPLLPLQHRMRMDAFGVESELRDALGLNEDALNALFDDLPASELVKAVVSKQ